MRTRIAWTTSTLLLGGCVLFTDLSSFSTGEEPNDAATAADAKPTEDAMVDATVDGAPTVDGGAPTSDGASDAGTDGSVVPCTLKSTGPKVGTSAVNFGSGVPWAGLTSALTTDGTGATASMSSATDESTFLVISGFGFAIPPVAQIRGIQVLLSRRGTDNVRDREIRLAPNGVPAGEDKEASDDWPSAFAPIEYGGPTALWQMNPKATDVTSAFGVAIKARYDAINGSGVATIDSVTMTITYCE